VKTNPVGSGPAGIRYGTSPFLSPFPLTNVRLVTGFLIE
jgi:hypothetical protein